jgi:hypothetical protein
MPVTLPNFPGTFVATYTAQGADVKPRLPIWLPVDLFKPRPKAFIPQSTIVILAFSADNALQGSLEGKIQRNPAGMAEPESPPLNVRGRYEFALNDALQAYEGTLHVDLLRGDGSVSRTQVLYVVCQDNDTILFMLRESIFAYLSGGEVASHPAGAIVQGIFKRVQ